MSIQLRKKKKIALVLSGGGIKASAFHLGVCLALEQKGIRFLGGSKMQVASASKNEPAVSLYVGSSAGAFLTALLASGHTIDSIIRSFQLGQLPDDKKNQNGTLPPIRYRDLFSLNTFDFSALPRLLSSPLQQIKTQRDQLKSIHAEGFESYLKKYFRISGFFSTKGIERYLDKKALPFPNFADLGVDLFVVSTQLNHSRKVIFGDFPESSKTAHHMSINNARIAQAVAASVALPPVFSPYGLKHTNDKTFYFYDGEIRDTLSTHIAADHGADLIISSSSIQPYHYNERVGSLHKFGIPAILNQALYQVIEQKISRHTSHIAQTQALAKEVDQYCLENNLGVEHKNAFQKMLEKHLNHRPNVEYIDISPRPKDTDMFFADHFSMNRDVLEKVVLIGFRSAISKLRELD